MPTTTTPVWRPEKGGTEGLIFGWPLANYDAADEWLFQIRKSGSWTEGSAVLFEAVPTVQVDAPSGVAWVMIDMSGAAIAALPGMSYGGFRLKSPSGFNNTIIKFAVKPVSSPVGPVGGSSDAVAGGNFTELQLEIDGDDAWCVDCLSSVPLGIGLELTALQPADIGVLVQAHDPVLDATEASFTTDQEALLGELGSGPDEYVLVSDPAEPTGVRWVLASVLTQPVDPPGYQFHFLSGAGVDPTSGSSMPYSPWGVTPAGDPYFDINGVAAADRAVLALSPVDGSPYLRRVVPVPGITDGSIIPVASDAVSGLIKTATSAEVLAGVDDEKAVTAAALADAGFATLDPADFATAAQGATADTALQPAAIGTTVAALVGGTVPDGQLPAGITRDSELTAAVDAAVNDLLSGAPGALDTLNELAAALGDDPNFAGTITTALAGKQPLDADLTSIAALATTAFGRSLLTLASSAAGRAALGLVIGSDVQAHSAALDGTTASFTSALASKLAGVETGATADQTGAQIKVAYEAELDTNAYDDAAVAKLAGIETSATADQTAGEIKTAYESNANTNAYDNAAVSKLASIEAGADATDVANVTAAGAIMGTVVNLKGDLLAASAPDSVARLPVGADTFVLTADSAEATGLKWAASAGGGGAGGIRPAQSFSPDAGAVTAGFDDYTLGFDESVILVTLNGVVLEAAEYSRTGTALTVTPADGFGSTADVVLVFQGTYDSDFATSAQGALATNAAPKVKSINAQTGTTYTLALADLGKVVTCSNAAAVTVTVPPNASVSFDVGSTIDVIGIGAGIVTIAQGAGVTVNATPSLVFRAQHSGCTLVKTATDTWQAVGDFV